MTEREFQTLIVKGAREVEKISIFKMIDGYNTGKKPFDISGISPTGRGIAIEAKITNKPQRYIPWSLFSSHQITWLRTYAEANAHSIVAIYYQATSECEFVALSHSSFNGLLDRTILPHVKGRKHVNGGFLGLYELLGL